MHDFALVTLFTLGSLGHVALWTILFNRLHTIPWPRRRLKLFERFIELVVILGLLAAVWWYLTATNYESTVVLGYAIVCWLVLLRTVVLWWDVESKRRNPSQLESNDTRVVDVRELTSEPLVAGEMARWLMRIPGNQVQQIAIQEKTIRIPGLPPPLDGLAIVHLSDLHYTGRQTVTYFQHLVELTNQLDADLIAITGDIVDKAHCIPWIPETLGRLQARHGCYFILGNHDKRVDERVLRGQLVESGLVDVAQESARIVVNEVSIEILGNEMPWFDPPQSPSHEGADFRVLLSHTPDQIRWAQSQAIHLMLAGHTHGGQICFPLIGPIISPSRFGTRYASGLFYEPPTILHVSRGISGVHPIRLNCPPELAKLVLRPA